MVHSSVHGQNPDHGFRAAAVIASLQHYLPVQALLKDFIHHNTLHAFQDKPLFEALREVTAIFGYTTLLPLAD